MLSRLFRRRKQPKEQLALRFSTYECTDCGKEHETFTESELCCGYDDEPLARPVGYGIYLPTGLIGVRGIGYDYIMDRYGLNIQARNDHITARVPIGQPITIKGLNHVDYKLELARGPIPGELFDQAIAIIGEDPERERFCVIVRDGEQSYNLVVPNQVTNPVHVKYETIPNTVFEIHSHGRMKAFFSSTDTKDEQGLAVYAVAGDFGGQREDVSFVMRLGVYGHFYDLLDPPYLIPKIFQPIPEFIKRRVFNDV